MNKKFTFAQSALLVSAAIVSSQANSAGFQIVEHSASGLGRAFAGEAAIADNASTLARNPASLSLLENANFTSGISFIDPDVQVQFLEETGNGGLTNAVYEDEAAPTALVPNAFYSRPINDKWTWGIGAYADFGLASDYSESVNKQFGEIAGDTAVSVINLNNSIAYEVTESLTLGASASILLAHAELNRYSSLASVAPNYDGNVVSSMEGDGLGFGYKVGALYELNDSHRFGLAYTGASDIDMEGKFSGLQLNSPEGDGIFHYFYDIDGELTLNLPSILEFSGYHQLNEKFAVHYSWVRIGWSSFQEILAKSKGEECSTAGEGDRVCLQKEEGWKDSNRYSVGATGKVTQDWTVRIGWAKDETPTDQHITASIPDSTRTWMTAGTTYQMDSHTFDFGIAYIKGEDGDIHAEDGMYFSVEKSTAMIYSAQYSYNF